MNHESITSVARQFNVSTRTIRYYEELGLIIPNRSKGQRVFSSKEKTRLSLILRGKKYGFQLHEIKEMIQLFDQDPSGVRQLEATIQYGNHKVEEVEERIEELQLLRSEMNGWLVKFNDELIKRKGES
ncbi:MerR family DNA-binding protein [Halobacillus seohaensis]|uniref:MerR family DNA-binding protein n=1 Tax=Halobacillus seohaensis TaxID=447421 RepID=A0ABW2EP24_9BACI